MRSELSWSLIDPKPVLLYVENLDDYLVYWDGIAMTHSMALCMAMERLGVWPTPEMRSVMESNYRRIYYAGGFKTRAWDSKVTEGQSHIYPYLKRIMNNHLNLLMEDRDPKEILSWFDYQKARKETVDSSDKI